MKGRQKELSSSPSNLTVMFTFDTNYDHIPTYPYKMISTNPTIDLSSALKGYDAIGREYRLKSAQKLMIDGLVSGKHSIIDPEKMNNLKKQKIDISFRVLSSSLRELETLRDEYKNELNRSKLIEKDSERLKSMATAEKPSSAPVPEPASKVVKFDQHAFEQRMSQLQIEQARSDALLQNLIKLTGIRSVDLKQSDDGLDMRVEVNDVDALLHLQHDMKLVDMEIMNDASKSLIPASIAQKIKYDAKQLTAPQDIRYVVFALSCAQRARSILTHHISDLRKRCLVSMLDTSSSSLPSSSIASSSTTPSYALQVTMSGGIVATMHIHECYPEIPGGVQIASLYGVGGWDANDLDIMKKSINDAGYRTIMDVYNCLVAKTV